MAQVQVQEDPDREERITMEAIVDAYGSEEQAMGWYYYLDDKITFPFQAKCIQARKVSPLKLGEVVEVTAMAPADDCEREMFVLIRWVDRELAVPLVQLEGIDVDDETEEAIADWHYWMARGYELG
ncbi:calcium-binding protein (plasmid) [Kovacikia minuta CCNUW1]|uniref:calcium-binding protein n=1 Tax=Kovacikia minuta TaxID=2931930 RepID=UPI001CCA4474|nr:calcium-binding protein [Kovacikia minuta]UBF30343.1 calcium-binding protein [Kovacikia minuta CCNUW1]